MYWYEYADECGCVQSQKRVELELEAVPLIWYGYLELKLVFGKTTSSFQPIQSYIREYYEQFPEK